MANLRLTAHLSKDYLTIYSVIQHMLICNVKVNVYTLSHLNLESGSLKTKCPDMAMSRPSMKSHPFKAAPFRLSNTLTNYIALAALKALGDLNST